MPIALSKMPVAERMAINIMRKEGFDKIYWVSLLNFTSPFDFIAYKDGEEYLIEVKPDVWHVSDRKLERLKTLGKKVLFLIVSARRGRCFFIPLEKFTEIITLPVKWRGRFDDKGRIVIPSIFRYRLRLKKGDTLTIDTYKNKKILLSPEKRR